jgi:hypothetical protein
MNYPSKDAATTEWWRTHVLADPQPTTPLFGLPTDSDVTLAALFAEQRHEFDDMTALIDNRHDELVAQLDAIRDEVTYTADTVAAPSAIRWYVWVWFALAIVLAAIVGHVTHTYGLFEPAANHGIIVGRLGFELAPHPGFFNPSTAQ